MRPLNLFPKTSSVVDSRGRGGLSGLLLALLVGAGLVGLSGGAHHHETAGHRGLELHVHFFAGPHSHDSGLARAEGSAPVDGSPEPKERSGFAPGPVLAWGPIVLASLPVPGVEAVSLPAGPAARPLSLLRRAPAPSRGPPT